NVNLNAPGRVAKIEKVALAHVAMRGDAAGGTKCVALSESRPNLRDVAAGLESAAKRFDTPRAKLIQFFAPERDQLILFLHLRRANVNRRGEMNSLNTVVACRGQRGARATISHALHRPAPCAPKPSGGGARATATAANIGLQRKDRQ